MNFLGTLQIMDRHLLHSKAGENHAQGGGVAVQAGCHWPLHWLCIDYKKKKTKKTPALVNMEPGKVQVFTSRSQVECQLPLLIWLSGILKGKACALTCCSPQLEARARKRHNWAQVPYCLTLKYWLLTPKLYSLSGLRLPFLWMPTKISLVPWWKGWFV